MEGDVFVSIQTRSGRPMVGKATVIDYDYDTQEYEVQFDGTEKSDFLSSWVIFKTESEAHVRAVFDNTSVLLDRIGELNDSVTYLQNYIRKNLL